MYRRYLSWVYAIVASVIAWTVLDDLVPSAYRGIVAIACFVITILFLAWIIWKKPEMKLYVWVPKRKTTKRMMWTGIALMLFAPIWFAVPILIFQTMSSDLYLDIFIMPSIFLFCAGIGMVALFMITLLNRLAGLIPKND